MKFNCNVNCNVNTNFKPPMEGFANFDNMLVKFVSKVPKKEQGTILTHCTLYNPKKPIENNLYSGILKIS